MGKLYGYAGKLLRVDLTNEKISEEELEERTARKYVGGTGIAAKYLYEEVPAGVGWSDEGNRLIMASGPLGGTKIGGSGTVCVATKGPLTNGAVATHANGFFGAFLRFSGYDGIIIQGKAKRWVYLYVHSGGVELKDASHLVGKDTWETPDLIKEELGAGELGMSVASIGVAGENLVKYACVFVDKGHAASHGGVGAVMGSKKLKAVAVARSRARPALKDKEGLSAVAKQFSDMTKGGEIYTWGTTNGLMFSTISGDGTVPVKNYTTNVYEIEKEKVEKFAGPYLRSHFESKLTPCWACKQHHCFMVTIPEGKHKGYVAELPEYECFAAFGPVIGGTDVMETMFLANEVDRMGLDGNETGWVLGLAIECYEKGVITSKDTGGIELTWGNYEAAYQMVRNIVTRQGFGDILAEGAMRAAQRIGGEAPNFAIHSMKGNTPKGHDHRTSWPRLFDHCLAQIATDEGYGMANPADLGLSVQPSYAHPNTSPEDTVTWNAQCKGGWVFEDCLGICMFSSFTNLKLLAQAVSAATGWDFPVEETMKVGKRINNLLRAFNIRHGHTAEMDAPSPRYGSAPVDGPAKGKSIMDHWDEMRSQYYEQMGWDKETGKPLPDTLKKLGLDYAIPELWES